MVEQEKGISNDGACSFSVSHVRLKKTLKATQWPCNVPQFYMIVIFQYRISRFYFFPLFSSLDFFLLFSTFICVKGEKRQIKRAAKQGVA